MKIAFISEFDANNPIVRSNVPYFLVDALKRLGHEVSIIIVEDNRLFYQKAISRIKQLYYSNCKKGAYHAKWSIDFSKGYARSISNFDSKKFDCVISISTAVLAYLKLECRSFLWIDNTYQTFRMCGLGKVCYESKKESNIIDLLAMQNATKVFVASGWLKNQIIRRSNFSSKQIEVLPRGTNTIQIPSKYLIEHNIENKIHCQDLQLLFVVTRWYEKGGETLIAIFNKIKESIPNCCLNIVGAIPEAIKTKILNIEKITLHGFVHPLEKDKEWYQQLLAKSHFLVLPTRAEGFGNMFAEAALYGIPSVAYSVMGVTESVKENITGKLLPMMSDVDTWVNTIVDLWDSKDRYKNLCNRAHDYAHVNFIWEKNCKVILDNV